MTEQTGSAPVKSAMRTLDIIEYVVSRDSPVIAQEIGEALAIPVSSLSYLLGTLVERGYLSRDGRRYLPGEGLARLRAGKSPTLAERIGPLVRTLRIQLNETASFFVRQGWEIEALVTETSPQTLRYAVAPGDRAPLHCFSAGKALLAALDEPALTRYFAESPRAAFTPSTVTSEAELRAEIERIRKVGHAETHDEYTLGIHGVGCVARMNGEPTGAFSVGIPFVRFDSEVKGRVIELLHRVTRLLEPSN